MTAAKRRLQYSVNIVFLVLSIIGYVFMQHDYKKLRHDQTVNLYPWAYVMTWSSLGIGSLVLSELSRGDIRYIGLLQLGVIAVWIWGWIIVADDTTWTILKHQYRPVWNLILAFQISAIFISVFTLSTTRTTDDDAVGGGVEIEV